jgi:hypothetical protein
VLLEKVKPLSWEVPPPVLPPPPGLGVRSSVVSELQASKKLMPKKANATVGQTSFKNDLLSFMFFVLNITKFL